MTSPLRALSLRTRALSLIRSQFIALTLSRLVQWRLASRHGLCPARSRYAPSAFRRFACLVMAVVMSLQVPASPHVSRVAADIISAKVVNSWQDGRFWWHSSGWAARYERLHNEFLPNIGGMAQQSGWDGRGAPTHSSPAPQAVETQQDREQRVARIKIFPGDVHIKTGEKVVFNAVAFDQGGNAVNGLGVKWSALHEEKNHPLTISHGTFVSGAPGRFIIMAEIAGHKEQVRVTVSGEPRRPGLRSRSETPNSSHESRRDNSLRAPTSGDQKQIAKRSKQARRAAIPEPLRAASAPMASLPVLQSTGADVMGWNVTNKDTIDDVGKERGHVPGRVADGGAGAGNFRFAAPAVVMDGRGIDLSLFLNYNSRVWHRAGSEITFDIDRDWIPGWSLGFGKIVMAGDTYFLMDSNGKRHPHEGVSRGNFPAPMSPLQTYEAHTTDGTFIHYYAEGYKPEFDNSGGRNLVTAWAVMPNGTRIEYGAQANYAIYPVRITDAHGNFINITYRNNQGPQLETITDTLGRVVQFHYDVSGLLTAITVPGLGGGTRVAVRLQYQSMTLNAAAMFAGFLTKKVRQNTISVIRAIYYPGTGTGYWFGDGDSYSPFGMIRKVSERRGMTFDDAPLNQQGNIGSGTMSREMVYNYPQFLDTAYTDMPTYTQMTEDWAGRTTASAPVTQFSVVDSGETRTTTITRPDGAQIVQIASIFHHPQFPWMHGTSEKTEIYRDGSLLSRSHTSFEPGVFGAPRPTRVQTTDERGRKKKTEYSYDWNHGSRYNAPTAVRVFGYGELFSGELLRRMHIEYLIDSNYEGALQNSGTLWWKQFGAPSGGPYWRGSHILSLVAFTEVYAGDDVTRLSRTEYQYDGSNLIPNPGIIQHNITYNPYAPPLEVCDWVPDPSDPDCNGGCPCEFPPCPFTPLAPGECDGNCNHVQVCHFVPQYDPKTGYRGNVTQIKSYADAVSLDQATAVVETLTYDVAGNLRVQSSSCCEQTTITCTTATQYAWPESLTSGSPSDPSKQNASSATYDYNTGLVMTSTDANGRVSDFVYDTNTLRPVRENSPTRGYQFHIYDDLNLVVRDFVYEAGKNLDDFASHSDKYLDGLGRVVKEVAFGKNYVLDAVETKFDNLGRVSQQTRPYRANSDLSPAETVQWSAVTYDSLNRPIQTTSPDGSIVTRAYNQSPDPPGASGQLGDTIKVTDPWGRERWARSDALGRLVEVAEPIPGGNGALSGGAMYTTYSYDSLDRLLQVNQGAQTRSFKYDSLGRLTHQKLAERDATLNLSGQWVGSGVWSDVFTYDNRSNVTQRVDARGVKTILKYKDAGGNEDPLNRLLAVEYDKSGSPAHLSVNIPDTPNVSYGYMTAGDKMRAENVFVANGMGNKQLSYDIEGRLSQVRQTFTGRERYPLFTNYLWDSLDRLKESAYPQQYGAGEIRKEVEPAYDIASRIESLKFGGTTYASNPVYNASSQMTSLNVGGQIAESYNYDPKTGLMTGQQVRRGAELLVDLKYNYTLNNDPDNNGVKTGQLTGVTDFKNQARNRAYEYDKLGRLGKVKGGVDAFNNPTWYQNYMHDRYGNRTGVTKTGDAPQIPLDGFTSLSFNTVNNRINTAGFEYDPAGNQTRAVINDSGTQQQYRYDCAGRLAQVLDASGSALATYSYGAGNQRLVSVEGGVTKYFAWDGGKIIAEYEAWGANGLIWQTSYVYLGGQLLATTSGIDGTETRFHHPDRLGTRLVTDVGGTVVTEQWTMPFGNMQPFTSIPGGENPFQHPTLGNPSKKRFTSYDRSDATGLDYAVNRFYSPQQGRFTQVDPIGMGAAELANPQSLNLYAYVENDPINSTDPLGLNGFTQVFRLSAVPTGGGGGGGWGGLRIGPFGISFSFSTGGGNFFNFSAQDPKKESTSQGVVYDTDFVEKIVTNEPMPLNKPNLGVHIGNWFVSHLESNIFAPPPFSIWAAIRMRQRLYDYSPTYRKYWDRLHSEQTAGGLMAIPMVGILEMGAVKTEAAIGQRLALMRNFNVTKSGGGDGLHVALGLTQDGMLFKFAKEHRLKTYFDVAGSTHFDPHAFTSIMQRADSIHFNTQGFDFTRFGKCAHRGGRLWMMRDYGTVTNYELREVLTTPAFKAKLVFH